jgi:hypothetical protein
MAYAGEKSSAGGRAIAHVRLHAPAVLSILLKAASSASRFLACKLLLNSILLLQLLTRMELRLTSVKWFCPN